MDNSLLVSLSQQLAAYRAMDVIANNLANASTPGFKREAAKFEEYVAHVRPSEDQKGPQTLSFVKDAGVMRDLGQGELTTTGSPYDFAINGKGFFTIQTPQGMRYTRDGHFTLNQDGVMVTADGYPVQGDGGPITVTPSDGQISVGPDGIISSILNGASNQIGKLQVVDFADERSMIKQGANLYSTSQTANPTTNASLAQGMLESSNVSPVIEISHMVEVMRAYQMTATMTNSEEDLMRQAIDKLGSTPN
jgi:flagellar basal-body rod protein FlgF